MRERHSTKLAILVDRLTHQKEEVASEKRRLRERVLLLEEREHEAEEKLEAALKREAELREHAENLEKEITMLRRQLEASQERTEKRGLLRRAVSRPSALPRHSLHTLLPDEERTSSKLVREQILQTRRDRKTNALSKSCSSRNTFSKR